MTWFEENATKEQIEVLDYDYAWYMSTAKDEDDKIRRTELVEFYKDMLSKEPVCFDLKSVPVEFKVKHAIHMKINGEDCYKITLISDMSCIDDSVFTNTPIEIVQTISVESKEKYIGDCEIVIMDTDIYGYTYQTYDMIEGTTGPFSINLCVKPISQDDSDVCSMNPVPGFIEQIIKTFECLL